MAVVHKGVRYNCRVVVLDGLVVLIRPKMVLANGGNYIESRWFAAWTKAHQIEDYLLPDLIGQENGQKRAPFGDAILVAKDCTIGIEVCEELHAPASPHVAMWLAGADIVANGSASHFELGRNRAGLVCGATSKAGGVYLYANQLGCDGNGLYFDGCPLIAVNGDLVAAGHQSTLATEIDVVSATIDLDLVQIHRSQSQSYAFQAASAPPYPRILVSDFGLCRCRVPLPPPHHLSPASTAEPILSDQIQLALSSWLWDYLRKSGAGGFFLPLSGGIDSCACALLVHLLATRLASEMARGNGFITKELQRILQVDAPPMAPSDLTNHLLATCYMQTANSTSASKDRATRLASLLNSTHFSFSFDILISSIVSLVSTVLGGFTPDHSSPKDSLAMQNLQARLRMVLAYCFAQLVPIAYSRPSPLLVLGASNADEALRGYFTKYDCSSGDINPVGSLGKDDLRQLVSSVSGSPKLISLLDQFLKARPSAELKPHLQDDESDMQMTYSELGTFATLRSTLRCGPVSMFSRLKELWPTQTSSWVAEKVKSFFSFYAGNRHKVITLTPACHAIQINPDGHCFDLRPFLYPRDFIWQFSQIG